RPLKRGSGPQAAEAGRGQPEGCPEAGQRVGKGPRLHSRHRRRDPLKPGKDDLGVCRQVECAMADELIDPLDRVAELVLRFRCQIACEDEITQIAKRCNAMKGCVATVMCIAMHCYSPPCKLVFL